jgi:hypothetical protein
MQVWCLLYQGLIAFSTTLPFDKKITRTGIRGIAIPSGEHEAASRQPRAHVLSKDKTWPEDVEQYHAPPFSLHFS